MGAGGNRLTREFVATTTLHRSAFGADSVLRVSRVPSEDGAWETGEFERFLAQHAEDFKDGFDGDDEI